ncbi:MAG: universal stress protein [Pseudomonadota bacterium]
MGEVGKLEAMNDGDGTALPRRRKFLVVVDQTPECLKALRFAARRAARTGNLVAMLYVIEPDEFQHWVAVADAIRAEARQQAEARMAALVDEVKAMSGVAPEATVREGPRRETVLAYLKSDPDVGQLVLGAGVGGEGPGPLVTSLAGQMSGGLPTPVTIVPGGMSNEEIDAMC